MALMAILQKDGGRVRMNRFRSLLALQWPGGRGPDVGSPPSLWFSWLPHNFDFALGQPSTRRLFLFTDSYQWLPVIATNKYSSNFVYIVAATQLTQHASKHCFPRSIVSPGVRQKENVGG